MEKELLEDCENTRQKIKRGEELVPGVFEPVLKRIYDKCPEYIHILINELTSIPPRVLQEEMELVDMEELKEKFIDKKVGLCLKSDAIMLSLTDQYRRKLFDLEPREENEAEEQAKYIYMISFVLESYFEGSLGNMICNPTIQIKKEGKLVLTVEQVHINVDKILSKFAENKALSGFDYYLLMLVLRKEEYLDMVVKEMNDELLREVKDIIVASSKEDAIIDGYYNNAVKGEKFDS